jgi:hypothetical protein
MADDNIKIAVAINIAAGDALRRPAGAGSENPGIEAAPRRIKQRWGGNHA